MLVCGEISCLLQVFLTQLQKISCLQRMLLNSDNHAHSLVREDTRNYFSPLLWKILEAVVEFFHCNVADVIVSSCKERLSPCCDEDRWCRRPSSTPDQSCLLIGQSSPSQARSRFSLVERNQSGGGCPN